jgi:cyclic-di-GMP-binding protein
MAKGDNSFDVACKVDPQAVADAVHQATREIQTRYDLKQTKSQLALEKDGILVHTDNDYVLKQVVDLLQSKLHRRGVPLKALTYGKIEPAAGGTVRQRVSVQQGIPMDKAKEIVRLIKDSKLKVQAAIQDKQVRISGKSRDDLQSAIALVRKGGFDLPLQYTNFRD